ncbi:MAG TPA: hypothetical protein VN969_31955 [Streptosporangiaceae bacterium]|nr:hypothetical protein [Streptosporangiaceae bacterium]
MTRVTDFAQAHEQCREVVACLDLPGPYDQEGLSAVLGRLIGGTVRMVAVQLPAPCTAVWLGCTGSDRIGYNQDWPEHEISLAGHTIGHLVLGHCGPVRDGGQLACTAARLDADDRRILGRSLHEPVEYGISRLFSDGEEHMASVFAQVLADKLGISYSRRCAEDWTEPDALTCVG